MRVEPPSHAGTINSMANNFIANTVERQARSRREVELQACLRAAQQNMRQHSHCAHVLSEEALRARHAFDLKILADEIETLHSKASENEARTAAPRSDGRLAAAWRVCRSPSTARSRA